MINTALKNAPKYKNVVKSVSSSTKSTHKLFGVHAGVHFPIKRVED